MCFFVSKSDADIHIQRYPRCSSMFLLAGLNYEHLGFALQTTVAHDLLNIVEVDGDTVVAIDNIFNSKQTKKQANDEKKPEDVT